MKNNIQKIIVTILYCVFFGALSAICLNGSMIMLSYLAGYYSNIYIFAGNVLTSVIIAAVSHKLVFKIKG